MRLAERAAEHGEVLAEHEHQAAVDHSVAGDHAVARNLLLGHAEVDRAVLDEHVPLFEGVVVQQQLDALARGELALGMLRVDALLPAAEARLGAALFELFNQFLHGVFRSCGPEFLCDVICSSQSRAVMAAAASRLRAAVEAGKVPCATCCVS